VYEVGISKVDKIILLYELDSSLEHCIYSAVDMDMEAHSLKVLLNYNSYTVVRYWFQREYRKKFAK